MLSCGSVNAPVRVHNTTGVLGGGYLEVVSDVALGVRLRFKLLQRVGVVAHAADVSAQASQHAGALAGVPLRLVVAQLLILLRKSDAVALRLCDGQRHRNLQLHAREAALGKVGETGAAHQREDAVLDLLQCNSALLGLRALQLRHPLLYQRSARSALLMKLHTC